MDVYYLQLPQKHLKLFHWAQVQGSPVHCTVLPHYHGKDHSWFSLYNGSQLSHGKPVWAVLAVRQLPEHWCVSSASCCTMLLSPVTQSNMSFRISIQSSSVGFWDISVLLWHSINNKLIINSPQKIDFPEFSPYGRIGTHNSLDAQLILVLCVLWSPPSRGHLIFLPICRK